MDKHQESSMTPHARILLQGRHHPTYAPPLPPENKEWEVCADDCCVVTATDNAMLIGAYAMIHTLLMSNEVDVLLYKLEPASFSHHAFLEHQLISWGVRILPPPDLFTRSHEGWQTWNKPLYIQDACRHYGRVFWIDADCSVASPLRHEFDTLYNNKFIVDHGFFSPDLAYSPDRPLINSHALEQWFGPFEPWEGHLAPCAGVCGFHSRRDRKWLSTWAAMCRRMCLNDSIRPYVALYDQGAMSLLLAKQKFDSFQPGTVYNDMRGPRVMNPQQFVDLCFGIPSAIKHYGGPLKPWLTWTPESLVWPDPRSRRHDSISLTTSPNTDTEQGRKQQLTLDAM